LGERRELPDGTGAGENGFWYILSLKEIHLGANEIFQYFRHVCNTQNVLWLSDLSIVIVLTKYHKDTAKSVYVDVIKRDLAPADIHTKMNVIFICKVCISIA